MKKQAKTKQTETENKFYSLQPILKKNADYNIIFGERSNGKTYAALMYGLKNYFADGMQFAYIRRWREDIRGKRGESLFNSHVANGVINELSGGEWDGVKCASNKYYLTKTETTENGKTKTLVSETPFCFAFALSEQEHEKSSSYPNVTTIIFDEFLTRQYYLPDEFMLLMNLLSTIIRLRENVKIFLLGNTVNKYCPYFKEFGLTNIATMQQGTIDVYKAGNNGAVIAVEYAATVNKNKKSNKYFCFDNQNLQMITGGKWELSIYPHLPQKYTPNDVVFIFYIVFNDTILQANIICTNSVYFMYIHAKTTPIKETSDTLIYSLNHSGKPNHRRRLISTVTELDKKITKFFVEDKVFFQSNDIGEIVRNYIKASNVNNLTN